jgi:transposase InsO family protein
MTFLRNHKDAIAAMDFFVVPTVRFQLLYVWFVLDHDRRRVIHFNVTTNPTASWVIRQLREAFPWDDALPFLVYDRDATFSADVTAAIWNLDSEPIRTAYRSAWQNPFAERWVGTCRRELLDHLIVLGERHLKRLLADHVAYYNVERVHTVLGDSPMGAPARPGLRRAQGWSPSLAWAASTIATHAPVVFLQRRTEISMLTRRTLHSSSFWPIATW